MNQALVEMKNITKRFPGVVALDSVSLTLNSGSVHALMGENGAGKSTLMKCLFGVYKKDSGEILVNGRVVEFENSKDALTNGVSMVHQELNQALDMSVKDNVWLGRYPKISKYLPIIDEKKIYKLTKEIFDDIGISVDPNEKIGNLSVSKRQMVEIAKAVSYDAKVIVFDEPTSSLSDTEAHQLFNIIRVLKERGCGIIYISHKMEEILKISDTVTIMRDGRHITTKEAKDLTTDEIIRLMVGRSLEKRYPEKINTPSEIFLSVRGLRAKYSNLKDANFDLRRGEILGVAGLDGSGRSELLETLFGLRVRESGEIILDGKKAENRNPREAIKNGFALLTEERRSTGIFPLLSITENTTISNIKSYRRAFILNDAERIKATEESIKSLKIKTPSHRSKIKNLSGGNQQKVILARWLLTKPRVLLLDEPTRGIDVGAKLEIYKIISNLAKEGHGIIMVSSEMPELIGVCDRIIVMSAGRVAGEVDIKDVTQEKLMSFATRFL
jgi:methyl-galactoside transport system ATP-binding protein